MRPKTAHAISAAVQGHGLFSVRQPPGLKTSQRPIPGARKSAEYFESAASPAARPAASHQARAPGPLVRARQESVSAQNRMFGASGTARMAPTATSTEALNQTAARTAVRWLVPNRMARSKTRKLASTDESTGSSRTPSGLSPAMVMPARIHQAIIGGWSK